MFYYWSVLWKVVPKILGYNELLNRYNSIWSLCLWAAWQLGAIICTGDISLYILERDHNSTNFPTEEVSADFDVWYIPSLLSTNQLPGWCGQLAAVWSIETMPLAWIWVLHLMQEVAVYSAVTEILKAVCIINGFAWREVIKADNFIKPTKQLVCWKSMITYVRCHWCYS